MYNECHSAIVMRCRPNLSESTTEAYVWRLKKNVFCLHFVIGQDSGQVEQACVFKVTFAPI